MSSPTITISAHCHCRRANFAYTVPASSSPLKSAICHCNSCRYATGQIFGTFAVIPSHESPDTSALAEFKSSATPSRYFCPTCGANVFNIEPIEWESPSGLLTKETRTVLELDRLQLWVSDTGDGGSAVWLHEAAKGKAINVENRESAEVPLQQVLNMRGNALDGNVYTEPEKLAGGCKCGNVKLYISRPKDGKGTHKASFCACTSCRLTSGFEITSWATIPSSNLFLPDGSLLDLSADIKGLQRYESSPGVERFFCQTCGAKAFFWNRGSKERVNEVEVSAGLLRAEGGALAENWLEWDRSVQYVEDAIDPDFVKRFAKALRDDNVR
jgi:hypothetical protein